MGCSAQHWPQQLETTVLCKVLKGANSQHGGFVLHREKKCRFELISKAVCTPSMQP